MFSKRAGTSGIRGQLYESKLLSLIYFRASLDDTIEEFQLASNVDNISAFDDICLKVKLKEHDKPVAVFIQAKHRETERRPLTYDLAIYFESYLKIRKAFKSSSKDEFFSGEFEETECSFVIYTNAPDHFNDESVECSLSSRMSRMCLFTNVHDIIGTGGVAKQPYKHTRDVDFLHKTFLKHQLTTLAERIANSVNKDNFQYIMSDTLVQTYHVILAQTVFDVSGIVPLQVELKLCKGKVTKREVPRHRIATFRHDFFVMNGEYLTIFKETLVKEVLKERKIKSADVKTLLSEYLAEPTDGTKLSKLIGTVVTYNNNHLEYLNKKTSTKEYRPQLNQVCVPCSIVNEAVELAAREIFLSREFKVPVAFGNKDLTISDGKIESRINYLTSVVKDLVIKRGSNNLVTIDDSLGKGFLQLNGGMASAIGNMFVLDNNTKLTKITDSKETLGDLAKKLYERLNNEIPNLLEYKFCFKVNVFPKLLLECTEYEDNFARDFLNKLIIFSNQADENGVEKILKIEVEEYQSEHPNYLQVHTDAIFSKYHDDVQKWWMQPEQALTRESNLFEKAKENIIKDPLLSVISAMYRNNIKKGYYTFTEDAVSSLNLHYQDSSTIITTEHCVPTVLKVMQHLKNNHFVIDLKYISKLPPKDRNLLLKELKDMNEGKVLILVCDGIQQDKKKILENIIAAALNKKTIIVTNHTSVEMLQKYFRTPPVHDENTSLINLTEESQKSILKSAGVIFQGTEVSLDLILDNKSKKYVNGDILDKIISEEIISVGKLIIKRNYEEMKHLYVDRSVKKRGNNQTDVFTETSKAVTTLETFLDVPNDVVLVTAELGMGKSTLLTHLSIKTKELKPEVWIVRINLLEYSEEFSKWKKDKTDIDLLETIKFMCQVILRDKLGKESNVTFTLEEKDNVVHLKTCTADPMTEFELNLFLHFYYEKEIIFLFDGFDEIGSHYTDVVIKCLKTVSNGPRKHRMLITSRSYNEVKTILEKEFGLSYEIDKFSYKNMEEYLQKFWEFNLRLEDLNSAQLENVWKLLAHVWSVIEGYIARPVDWTLYQVIRNAALYASYKIRNSHIPLWEYNPNFHRHIFYGTYNNKLCDCCRCCYCVAGCRHRDTHGADGDDSLTSDTRCDVNPLIMYLVAVDVVNNIKMSDEWYLDVDTYNVYDNFLKNIIKRRYQEKNKMRICNPDIITVYEKELASSILKHKKLAVYTIFNEYSRSLIGKRDLNKIKNMIKFVEKGEEKTDLIESVANGIPIFIHRSFAEYFAVEYICDCLKNEKNSEKIIYFDVIFSEVDSFVNLRQIFDHKMNTDNTLVSALENNKDVIFKWILSIAKTDVRVPFLLIAFQKLNNIGSFFDKIINDAKDNTDLSDSEYVELSELLSLHRTIRIFCNYYGTLHSKFQQQRI